MKDNFSAYKQAIKAQYEEEKQGNHMNLLLHPTSAKLRKLCVLLLKASTDPNDKKIFASFFGFEFELDSIGKIKRENDRFKRFCNFLKGKNDLSEDMDAADLLALLVGYKNRPYQKFINSHQTETEIESVENESPEEENITIATFHEDEPPKIQPEIKEWQQPERSKKPSKQNYLIILLLGVSLLSGGYMAKDICFPKKQCMQWQENHYEVVDCEVKRLGLVSISPVEPLDEDLLEFKKVKLKKGMEFFKYKKPLYYYYKVSRDSIEFFNAPGEHPITKKPLKEISDYIIDKYVK
ncbi:hypothetical protein J2X31_003334 [Flavobacterium arsenatis]|uniref:Uncharacterized protein n=1 Tax=Flavobacterium arsenatis TaxID=1484332 RepID=A0ABU1TTT9_9FLAO|nr:hypothetical protein [Flavobacterium arsenatis]MDR6969304.1 hypothetical protein [Flavobacterium arsenatis]